MELVFQDVSRFDIIHFHTGYLHFPLLRSHPCPSVTTLHGRLHGPDVAALLTEYNEVPLVSISNQQRQPAPQANWQATVYHGVPRDLYTYREVPAGYLAFLGRVSPENGVDRAIEIANRSGLKLKIAARVHPEERSYFDEEIQPMIRESASLVEFVGEICGSQTQEFLGNARALVFPIDSPEPFGPVTIEAMACGTPIVAWRNGSVPEVIIDGVTGFVVDNIAEAVSAVERVDSLSRLGSRRTFEHRFDARRMALEYVKVYRKLVDNRENAKARYAKAA